MGPKIGVITEQGDLGLGFDVLNEHDQKSYKQNESTKGNSSEKDDKRKDNKR